MATALYLLQLALHLHLLLSARHGTLWFYCQWRLFAVVVRYAEIVKEATLMKVVVFKSSKMLSGILRLFFGIKKEPNVQ